MYDILDPNAVILEIHAESNKTLPLFVFQLCTQKFLQFNEPTLFFFSFAGEKLKRLNSLAFGPLHTLDCPFFWKLPQFFVLKMYLWWIELNNF